MHQQTTIYYRSDIINILIKSFNYSSYLEIGVDDPALNFDKIDCIIKQGIDPNSLRRDILKTTSDDYFKGLKDKFDLIFIDGLHHCQQVLRDIKNSLKHLNQNGTIVCHDMLPSNVIMQLVPRLSNIWTGDCWKAWGHLRMTRQNLSMFVINTDYGIGVIKKGFQKLYVPRISMAKMDYSFFYSNKKDLMNILTISEFIELFDKSATYNV
ncbi:class I SAM-dependent methyltransferase [Compostibacter hankyongensis]|uniref:Class I SAM-dependent methyltransferase n=1 Tax=Compostibacter hankyongensis TaxID=1007089 RepID=A0ABP8FSA8_9BACT